MSNQPNPRDEFHRLRTQAAQTRVLAMRSQISLGLTLCRIMETEWKYGHVDKAQEIGRKLRKLTETVDRHLNEENYVPPNDIDKLRQELLRLETTISATEERHAGTGARPPVTE